MSRASVLWRPRQSATPDSGLHPMVFGVTQADVTDQGTHAPYPAADLFAPEGTPIFVPEACDSQPALYQYGGYATTLQGLDTGRWYYLAHGQRAFESGRCARGDVIGAVGSTGTGPGGYTASGGTSSHLHLAISSDGDFSRGYRGGSGDIWPTPDLWEMVGARGLDLFWSTETIAAVSECNALNIERNWPIVARALHELGIYDRNIAAGTIGTIAIETASTFAPVREAFWLSEEWRRANLRYYPYYGRGFVQTTWASNYHAVQDVLGIPCVDDPDLLLDPWNAARALAIYFRDRGVASAAQAQDWSLVRYRVLGAYNGIERLVGIANTLLDAE
jgi:hypothetical protein